MKKLFFLLLIVIILALLASYTLVPSTIRVSSKKTASTTAASTANFLLNEHAWKKWWLGTITRDSVFSYADYNFSITKKTINTIDLDISYKQSLLKGSLIIIPVKNDSVILGLQCQVPTGNNPLKRITTYFSARQVEKIFDAILYQIKTKLEDTEFVYGISISEETVTDTLLVSTKMVSSTYPSTDDAYRLINQLESLINRQGAKAINPPMLHVRKIDSTHYQTMTALPIDKWVIADKNTAIKRMVMGNILTTEISGGPSTIQRAYMQVQQYIFDHALAQPAIPYESLITNRMEIRDTSKWVTKIYFPVL